MSVCAGDRAAGASLGRHARRNRANAPIEQTADTTSTSHGPWKLEIRYCGTANERPATASAGHTSIVFLNPAKTATSQNGIITLNTGN